MILIHIYVKKKHLHCWVISHVYIFVFHQYMLYIVDMNKKYIKYINYIINDIELPYLKCLEQYGLKGNEYKLILSKVFNQPVTIKSNRVYDTNGKEIYYEDSYGLWVKKEYDTNDNEIYQEYSNGSWLKREYDNNNNEIYFEKNNGYWEKYEYNSNNNEIYYENSNGVIIDKR